MSLPRSILAYQLVLPLFRLFRQLSNWDFYKCVECIIIEVSWEQLPCHAEKTELLVLWFLTIFPHLQKCYLDDGISLCQSDQLGAHCVDQTGFELTDNHLVLKDIRGMCYYSCFNLTFTWSIPLLSHPPPLDYIVAFSIFLVLNSKIEEFR